MIPSLYTTDSKKELHFKLVSGQENYAIVYHNLFDFPMTFADLIRWKSGEKCTADITSKKGYFYIKGREGLVYKRALRERISDKKMAIAQKASKFISFIPTVKMVAVTGSLAMQNASDESDIDLMIVTKRGCLWTTRVFVYMAMHAFGLDVRQPNDLRQKNKLCLNMWLDENDLVWKKRNIYSSHEIAQIAPLINKDRTYEKFLFKNKWILSYWPNAVKIKRLVGSDQPLERKLPANYYSLIIRSFEKLAFKLQYSYMKPKITREVVTPTRALFHPQDWEKVVLGRLST